MIHNKRPVTHNTNVKIVDMPEGHQGEGFMAMQLSKVVGLARKNSIWPLRQVVVVLSLWQQWDLHTIWLVLVLSV